MQDTGCLLWVQSRFHLCYCCSACIIMLYCSVIMKPGPQFNIKMSSYRYRKSLCGDKTVIRSSYLHNGISYTGKMSSLYWIRAQTLFQRREQRTVVFHHTFNYFSRKSYQIFVTQDFLKKVIYSTYFHSACDYTPVNMPLCIRTGPESAWC